MASNTKSGKSKVDTGLREPSGRKSRAKGTCDPSQRQADGRFLPGSKGGPGRGASPNVVSTELRTAIMQSLQTKKDLSEGGDAEVLRYLVKDLKFSSEVPLRLAYANLVKQMAPKNINVQVEKTLADYVAESWASGLSN